MNARLSRQRAVDYAVALLRFKGFSEYIVVFVIERFCDMLLLPPSKLMSNSVVQAVCVSPIPDR